jgi:hypothetical protein
MRHVKKECHVFGLIQLGESKEKTNYLEKNKALPSFLTTDI